MQRDVAKHPLKVNDGIEIRDIIVASLTNRDCMQFMMERDRILRDVASLKNTVANWQKQVPRHPQRSIFIQPPCGKTFTVPFYPWKLLLFHMVFMVAGKTVAKLEVGLVGV